MPELSRRVLTTLVVVLVAVAIYAAVFLLVRRDRLDTGELAALASARGWTSWRDESPDGESMTLAPPDGAWKLTFLRRRSRTVGHVSRKGGRWTAWTAEAPAIPDGLLAVRSGQPVPPQAMALGAGFLRPLLERALTEMAGGEIGPVSELHAVQTGIASFDVKNAVICSSPELVRMLDAEVCARLEAGRWPIVLLSRNGLRVAREGFATDAAEIDALVALGTDLARRLSASRAP